jgi:hypothetical protein
MSNGQHVGRQADSLTEDEGLSAFRSQQRALAALARPIAARRGPAYDIGDGDPCPVHARKMLVIRGTNRQHCPDQSHDGVWSKDGHEPQSRAFWPLNGFEAAVRQYNERVSPVELLAIDISALEV